MSQFVREGEASYRSLVLAHNVGAKVVIALPCREVAYRITLSVRRRRDCGSVAPSAHVKLAVRPSRRQPCGSRSPPPRQGPPSLVAEESIRAAFNKAVEGLVLNLLLDLQKEEQI